MNLIFHDILFLWCLVSFAEPPTHSQKTTIAPIITKNISSVEKASSTIVFQVDSTPEYGKNTLSKLQDNDSISIYYQSHGCFHATAFKIIINKQDGKYFASLYDVNWKYGADTSFPTMKSRTDSILKVVVLTRGDIHDFNKFERELGLAKDGLCTTTDFYQFRSKYRNLDRTDGSCSWRGFYALRKSLFGEIEL